MQRHPTSVTQLRAGLLKSGYQGRILVVCLFRVTGVDQVGVSNSPIDTTTQDLVFLSFVMKSPMTHRGASQTEVVVCNQCDVYMTVCEFCKFMLSLRY